MPTASRRTRLAAQPPRLAPGDPSVAAAAVRADVATRIARVCHHLPPASFAVLVDAIAARTLRWATTEATENR